MSTGLRVESLSVNISGRSVVEDVSFEVRPGEVVGLLGRNGVGKTTLLRVVSGVLAADGGQVVLDGTPLSRYSRRALARKLAVVPQDTQVPFPFRVIELVLMGRAPHQPLFGFEGASDLARARRSLERMGIEDLADRSVFELSGGERQLVAIARALTQDPELLLLDEPTAFLDLRHRIDVMGVVRALAAEGRGALVVSHDIGLAARVCDRLVLLAHGAVAAVGPPAEVLTAESLAAVFGIRAQVMEGPDGLPVVLPQVQ